MVISFFSSKKKVKGIANVEADITTFPEIEIQPNSSDDGSFHQTPAFQEKNARDSEYSTSHPQGEVFVQTARNIRKNDQLLEFNLPNTPRGSQSPFSRSHRHETSSLLNSGSPGRMSISERMKLTPSTYVRQSRAYSNSISLDDAVSTPSASSQPSALSYSRNATNSVSPEISPIVNLILAQRFRTYVTGSILLPALDDDTTVWVEYDGKISGLELTMWRPAIGDLNIEVENNEMKPIYINLGDSSANLDTKENEISILQNYDKQAIILKFESEEETVKWFAAINLAKFENVSLNEAFTAVLLANKGSKLSDIHVLMAHSKHFSQSEWYEVRMPQLSHKWAKLLAKINVSGNKKNGSIELYVNDRKSKKTLVAYIPNVSSVYNVYPEHVSMIENNAMMKLSGEVFVNKEYIKLFKMEKDPVNHKRNTSISSISSNLASPLSGLPSRQNTINSTRSSSSVNSNPESPWKTNSSVASYVKKKSSNFFVLDYIYILPKSHASVSPLETMLRNFIHIIDAFKLYGRPKHLVSDKSNPDSLVFGLPSLPRFQFLPMQQMIDVTNKNLTRSLNEDWTEWEWRGAIKDSIASSYEKNKGFGNINDLYREIDSDSVEIYSYDINSPKINMPSDSDITSPSNEAENSLGSLSNSVDNTALDMSTHLNTITNPKNYLSSLSKQEIPPQGSIPVELGDPFEFSFYNPGSNQNIDESALNQEKHHSYRDILAESH